MAVRGVYSDEEKELLRAFDRRADTFVGWVGNRATPEYPFPVAHDRASADVLSRVARSVDPWNPLWNEPEYAATTRWGGLIAFPLFPRMVCHGGSGWLGVFPMGPPEVIGTHIGNDWELLRPIRVGDSLRVYHDKPQVLDVTGDDPGAHRKFKVLANHLKFYNQDDELAAVFKRYFGEEVVPGGTTGGRRGGPLAAYEDHRYTDEELGHIRQLAAGEEIRGARIRYWEDVRRGEQLQPVVMGPLSSWDLMVGLMSVGLDLTPLRFCLEQGLGGMLDMETGATEHFLSGHLVDQWAGKYGQPRAVIISSLGEAFIARLVTNWMGDDGWLKTFSWQMGDPILRGDTIIGHGTVTRTYMEGPEHLVELSLWSESMTRRIRCHQTTAVVSLPSRALETRESA
jgi:hypothetical protein